MFVVSESAIRSLLSSLRRAARRQPRQLPRRRPRHPERRPSVAVWSGDTTTGGLRRFDETLISDTRVLVLELGANDGLRGVDIPTVEKNLSAMIERAQSHGVKVLLCGMETPPLNGWNYTLEFHQVFPRIAQRYNIPLVPFLLEGVALNPDMNGDDEIHPNAAGAKRIAETVWPYLEPLVQQPVAASR